MSATTTYKGKVYQGLPSSMALLLVRMVRTMPYIKAKRFLREDSRGLVEPFRTMTYAALYVMHKKNDELEKIKDFYTEHKETIDFLVKAAEAHEKRDSAARHESKARSLSHTDFHDMRADYPTPPSQVTIDGTTYNRDGWSWDQR